MCIIQVYGDQAMPYPDKYLPDFDLFTVLKLFLTPMFTIIR